MAKKSAKKVGSKETKVKVASKQSPSKAEAKEPKGPKGKLDIKEGKSSKNQQTKAKGAVSAPKSLAQSANKEAKTNESKLIAKKEAKTENKKSEPIGSLKQKSKSEEKSESKIETRLESKSKANGTSKGDRKAKGTLAQEKPLMVSKTEPAHSAAELDSPKAKGKKVSSVANKVSMKALESTKVEEEALGSASDENATEGLPTKRAKKLEGESEEESKWLELREKYRHIKPKIYKLSESYQEKSPLEHKVLGWGFILSSVNDRLEVLFRSGIKQLISNYKPQG